MMITVDYDSLHLAGEVLDRQADSHLAAISDYLETWARLDRSDLGLVLQVLEPINESLVDGAQGVLALAGELYRTAGANMHATRETYARSDDAARAGVVELHPELGLPATPPTDGALPALGPAQGGAWHGYGDSPNTLPTLRFLEDIDEIETYLRDRGGRAVDRALELTSANPAVVERQDASSFLVRPQVPDSGLANLRWSAGSIVGSLDWVFSKLFHYSLIEDVIMKPLAGNWTRIGEASAAWAHTDAALVAVGGNAAGLCPPLASWTGRGSEACLGSLGAIAAGTTALSYAAGYAARLLGAVAWAAKKMAGWIGKLLKRISHRLMGIAVKAAVPAVGWVAAVGEAVLEIDKILSKVRSIKKCIDFLYKMAAGVVEGAAKVAEVRFVIADLVEGLARATAARVA